MHKKQANFGATPLRNEGRLRVRGVATTAAIGALLFIVDAGGILARRAKFRGRQDFGAQRRGDGAPRQKNTRVGEMTGSPVFTPCLTGKIRPQVSFLLKNV